MRRVVYVALAILGLAAGAALWIGLAPSDPARWHVDMAAPGFRPEGHWAQFCPRPGSRFAPEMGDPAATLARLDAIATAHPRTMRLAGGPAEGRITWITRSRLLRFPDYTTAQVLTEPDGRPRLCILARQRFGGFDWGVNGARTGGWAQELLGLDEPPDLVPF